ncbi:MAG: hypothetical protein ACRELX_08275 [Longimicrobiales bacterium]
MLAAALLLAGCGERARPAPTDVDAPVQLSVEVLAPRDNETVVAGRDLVVRVHARDLRGASLAGVGFIVRRAGSTLDSVSLVLDVPVAESTQAFHFPVPAALTTNTHLEVFGIAYGPGALARVSVPRAVVVARCQPFQTGCG